MNVTQVFSPESDEQKKLELAAAIMTYLSPNRRVYMASVEYLDYDAGLLWTTIVGETGWTFHKAAQVLTPAQQKRILEAVTVSEIETEVRDILKNLATDSGEIQIAQRTSGKE